MATLNDIGVPATGWGILKPYRYGESAEIYARRCALATDYYRSGLRDQNEYNRMIANQPLHEYERLTWEALRLYSLKQAYDDAKQAVIE